MVLTRKTYNLDRNAVDTVSGEIQDYLNSLKIERSSVQEIRHLGYSPSWSYKRGVNTVSLICGFIPLFVFVMLLRLNWSNNDIEVFSVWKPLALTLGCELILTLVIWLAISAYLKCPPMTLMRKVFPLFVVAFTTASSMAAMPLCMETCEKSWEYNAACCPLPTPSDP